MKLPNPFALISATSLALAASSLLAAPPAQLDDGMPTTLRPANYKGKYPADPASIARGE